MINIFVLDPRNNGLIITIINFFKFDVSWDTVKKYERAFQMLFEEEKLKDWYLIFLSVQEFIIIGDSVKTALLYQIFLKFKIIIGSSLF